MALSSIERLAAQLGVGSGSRKIGRTTLVRLSVYYGVVFVIVAGFIVLTDNMRGAMLGAKAGTASNPGALSTETVTTWRDLTQGFWDPLFRSLPPLTTGAAAVIGSFLLALPVAFTYVRTRNSLKYDQSLVQTVIMLPVVVTAILIVVANSLALAFSLAGIVAAVRFRNNLKDSRDAVYIFAAIGIGFASGVGMLAIAAFLSSFFCILELLLWKLDLTADHEHTFGMLCLPAPPSAQRDSLVRLPAVAGEASAPMRAESAASGDSSVETPSADTGLLAMGGGKPDPGNDKAKRPAERLLVYTTDPEKARRLAETVLDQMTKGYKFKKTRNGGNDQFVLEYRVRTRRKSPADAIIDRLHAEGVPYVIAAEVVAADAAEESS
jgi:uncharacterized protein DUF4956